jgi:uncharacterized delta-60 repeat protein
MKRFIKCKLFFLFLILTPALSFGSLVNQGFNAFVTKTNGSYINTIVKQPDGKFLIGGNFEIANGKARSGLARFNNDGTLDQSFVSTVSGTVSTLMLQEDGKLLVGGFNVSANGNGTFRYGILRLNSDGSVDTGFFNGSGGYGVYAIARQGDGKIIIGGNFTTFNGVNVNRIVRLNLDGSLDLSFNAVANDLVNSIVIQSDGKILVGGGFTNFNTQPRRCLVRLNTDGSLDSTFGITVDYQVTIIKILPDGKMLLAGSFTTIAGQERKTLARLNADGTVDLSFNYVNEQYVGAPQVIEIQPDGKIIIGGLFSGASNSGFKGLYRLNSNGSFDNQFTPLDVGAVYGVNYQPNGQIIVGGFRSGEDANSRAFFALINSDGSNNPNFPGSIGTYGTVNALATQTDGKVLVGGDFVEVNGKERRRIARLNLDGTLDSTFNPGNGANDLVQGLALQSDGKVVLCGRFGLFNGVSQYNLIRLNNDGSVDSSFVTNVDVNGQVSKCVAQSDGKIIIAESFNFYGGVSRKNLARLNTNGSLDTSFDAGVGLGNIQSILPQPDGKILLCGQFTKSIIRLNSDGTVDTGFNVGTGAAGIISAFAIQSDGKIVIGGSFSAYNGVLRSNLARINNNGSLDLTFNPSTQNLLALQIQPNGRIIVGGYIPTSNGMSQKYLGRFNTDGSLDYTFRIGLGADNPVFVLSQEPDGSIIAGGVFRKFDGQDHAGIAKINTISAFFDFDEDGKSDLSLFRPSNGIWYLNQSQIGFTGIQFGISSDKLVPDDYDGDGKTDVAVFRNDTWFIQRSDLGFTNQQFGQAGDIPVPADYDADGKTDLAVYRPSSGTWFLQRSTLGFTGIQFGIDGDIPMPGDFDGDGKADLALFRPSNGIWYILGSTQGFYGVQFGAVGDKLVPADYDGDGKIDLAVFRPSNATWYINRSQLGLTAIQFGVSTDTPVPADYDGDGKADIAVYRNDTWFIQRSTAGFTGVQFGGAGDQPIPNAFVR